MQFIWRRLKDPESIHVASLTTASYVSAAIGLLRTIFEARLLGPVDFGFAAVVLAYPRLVWSFSTLKSLSITSRYIAEYRATGREQELRATCKLGYVVDVAAMTFAFAVVVVSGAWAIEYGFAPRGSLGLMTLYAASLPIWSLHGTSRAVLVSWRRFDWIAIAHASDAVLTFSLVLLALLGGFGVPGLIGAMALAQVASGLLMFAIATRVLASAGSADWWRVPFRSLAPLARELAPLLGWNYLITTLAGVLVHGPVLLLGRSRGPTEAGYFRLASTIINAASELPVSMGRVAFPTLSERWAVSGRSGLRSLLMKWTTQGGLAVGVGLGLSVPVLGLAVSLLFGGDYEPMVDGLRWMMIGAALTAPFYWLSPLAYATKQLAAWAVGFALQTVVVIGLGSWLAPKFGFVGMAVTVSFASVAFTLGMIAFLWRVPPR